MSVAGEVSEGVVESLSQNAIIGGILRLIGDANLIEMIAGSAGLFLGTWFGLYGAAWCVERLLAHLEPSGKRRKSEE